MIKVVLDRGAYKPEKAHRTDAGFDLRSPMRVIVPASTGYGAGTAVIDTGVHIAIPEGWAGVMISKSGLNRHYGIQSTGLVDAPYRGSIVVKLYNHSGKPYIVERGDKISQLVITPISTEELVEVEELDETERGENGFGSSGR